MVGSSRRLANRGDQVTKASADKRSDETEGAPRVGVVIPCYRCAGQILDVLAAIPESVSAVFVVDDACPEKTGDLVAGDAGGPRVSVIRHAENRGVGGAMITGYRAALEAGCDIVVKLDGDGQMDPALIPRMTGLIARGEADYCKGNRFYYSDHSATMPRVRFFGNAALSFLNKAASGYWSVFDPTNGFTAIHRSALSMLPLEKIDRGYFFESDMLFRLGVARAVVKDVPTPARYAGEVSSLDIRRVLLRWPGKLLRNMGRRLIYRYYLHDFSLASLEMPLGGALLAFGLWTGASEWVAAAGEGRTATAGTVMLAALPIILGVQFLLAALQYDIATQPRTPLQRLV